MSTGPGTAVLSEITVIPLLNLVELHYPLEGFTDFPS
jgi:hypothetical protein